MNVSLERFFVKQCDKSQHTINRAIIKSNSVAYLDFFRSANASYSCRCQQLAAKASRTFGTIGQCLSFEGLTTDVAYSPVVCVGSSTYCS